MVDNSVIGFEDVSDRASGVPARDTDNESFTTSWKIY